MNTLNSRMSAGKHFSQRGLTLVEVMISLALGLFIMAGISELYVSSKHSFRMQGAVTALEENTRFAMDKLSYAFRMAGHFAGVDPAAITTAVNINGNAITGATPVAGAVADNCNQAFIQRVDEGLKGYEAQPPCVAAADWVAGTDAFVVRFADANEPFVDASLPIGGNRQVLIRSSIASSATMFEADDPVPAPAWENGVYNYAYNFSLFFIRACSNRTGAVCAATDDDNNPIPTLVRVTLDDNGGITEEELVEGIEMMRLRYGRDTDDDGAVDIYQTASEIATAAGAGPEGPLWNQVQTVEIALVARGDAPDMNNNTYALGKYNVASVDGANTILQNLGVDGFVNNLNASELRYPRNLFTTVVDLYNR